MTEQKKNGGTPPPPTPPVEEKEIPETQEQIQTPPDKEDIPERPMREKNESSRDYGKTTTVGEEAKGYSDRNKFDDDRGDPTYYYLNVSQGKVVIGDLDLTLATGAPVDLLDLAGEEALLKSKHLRQAERGRPDHPALLKRLVPAEFERLYEKFRTRQSIIAKDKDKRRQLLDKAEKDPKAIKKLSNVADNELDIRPQLQALVEKLRVGTLQVNDKEAEQIVAGKVAGITPEEFLMKFEVMQPSRDEVDFVFQTVMDKTVRSEVQKMYDITGE